MANLHKKVVSKQKDSSDPSFIVLTFDYNSKYILPIEYGKAIVEALAHANRLTHHYGKDEILRDGAGDVGMTYMTKDSINELRMLQTIDPEVSDE